MKDSLAAVLHSSLAPRILLTEPYDRKCKVSGISRTVDDFTIVLPQLRDMGTCDLEVYSEITELWQMVERYKMTTPITIKIADHKDGYIRTIRGRHDQIAGWQLLDEPRAIDQMAAAAVEFPLTIRVEDAKGNVLKMRLQVEQCPLLCSDARYSGTPHHPRPSA